MAAPPDKSLLLTAAASRWRPGRDGFYGAHGGALCLDRRDPSTSCCSARHPVRFPHPALTRPLLDARIGLEVMDLGALCRTYNILIAEGRNVGAAVLIDPD